jgi:hypothetical protein
MIVVLGVSMIVVNTLSMFNLVKIINNDGFKEGNTPTIKGIRYIRIVNSTQKIPNFIQIGAIKAFDNTNVDVAFRKTVTSSGNWPGYDAYKAVDGNIVNGKIVSDMGSSFHSTNPPNGKTDYWQVDLGQGYLLKEIRYYNRQECCQDRINGQTMILKNSDGVEIKKILFTSSGLEQIFPIYTDKEIEAAVAEAAIIADATKIKAIAAEISPNQTAMVSTFKNKSDSDIDDSDDDNDSDSDDENSNYMQDKTIINKLKKMDPVITDVLMNMKNGHIDIINKTLNNIIDENVLDV